MSFEFGGSALEVAIGLAFVFFLLSTVVSAITEGIAWARGMRAKQLREGLKGMLGEAFSGELLNHPLTRNDLSSTAKGKDPSYISPRNFSMALVELLKDEGGPPGGDTLQRVTAGVEVLKEDAVKGPLGEQLHALLDEAEGSMTAFRRSAETWFDDTMDRVSGWYKRWSQWVNIFVALVVAVGLNASAIRIAERLVEEPAVRASVVTKAEAAAQKPAAGESGKTQASEASLVEAGETAEGSFQQLDALELPILWSGANDTVSLATVVGWLITAIAISLGAPFWFDALGKLAHLKTTGKKPEKEPGPAT